MKTKLLFADGKEIELEVSNHSPLALGLVWSVHLDIPRPKNKWTVVGVYVAGSDHGERFADHIEADSWGDAEDECKARRGSNIMIAAVVEGEISCADEQ